MISETQPNRLRRDFLLQTRVRPLLAEQLNNFEWRSKTAGPPEHSSLKGPINKVGDEVTEMFNVNV